MRLLIAVPSVRDWKCSFGASLLNLVHRLDRQGIGEKDGTRSTIELTMHLMSAASLLPAARQKALDAAIEGDHTHLLFIDDDMAFNADILDRLYAHDVPVVGVNYVSKGHEGKPTAMTAEGMLTSIDKEGLQQVIRIGMGLVLIQVDKIKHVPCPHFQVLYLADRGGYLGEDYYFCHLLTDYKVDIFVDHSVSHDVLHIGDFPYREIPKTKTES